MNIYEKKWWWKVLLMILAFIIVVITFTYTNKLSKKMALEEVKKVEQFAEAIWLYPQIPPEDSDHMRFFNKIVSGNTTIPVILTDEFDNIQAHRNIDTSRISIEKHLEILASKNEPLKLFYSVPLSKTESYSYKSKIYYDNSILLTQLRYYPVVQLGIIGMFLLISYFAFSSARKAEQNQVWVGMAKETAHQLGTPLSSMVGWIEYLKMKEIEGTGEIMDEISKDVSRLALIAERFSKIGSQPKLEVVDLTKELTETVQYAERRASEQINFSITTDKPEYSVNLSPALFDWVIENILKNALDAMDNKGTIKVDVTEQNDKINIELFNSGKYIPKSNWKTIFQPGYSTKKRGWGLGLSLSKRIIESFHKGKIYVKNSKENEGTTFKIELPKAI